MIILIALGIFGVAVLGAAHAPLWTYPIWAATWLGAILVGTLLPHAFTRGARTRRVLLAAAVLATVTGLFGVFQGVDRGENAVVASSPSRGVEEVVVNYLHALSHRDVHAICRFSNACGEDASGIYDTSMPPAEILDTPHDIARELAAPQNSIGAIRKIEFISTIAISAHDDVESATVNVRVAAQKRTFTRTYHLFRTGSQQWRVAVTLSELAIGVEPDMYSVTVAGIPVMTPNYLSTYVFVFPSYVSISETYSSPPVTITINGSKPGSVIGIAL